MSRRIETKRPLVLAAVMLAMFMAAVEATIVATAMPGIVADLGGFSHFSWVFSSYLLMQVVTIPIYGKLADLYGRKLIFSIGIGIFLLGSLLCGFSWSMEILIISRFIQGLGAGAVQPIATTIVGDIYSLEERGRIQGYLSSVWGVSAIIGPLLGAFFINYFHWSWIFWINIPFGLLSMVIVIIYLVEKVEKKKRNIDFVGAILLFITICTLMVVLVQFDDMSMMFTYQLIILLGISMISLFLFILHERKVKEPIVTFSLWKQKDIKYSNLASFTSGAILLAVTSYLPTYVQGVLDQTPLIAGLTLTVISVGWPISSMIAGRMMVKTGFRVTASIGGLGLLFGSACYLFLPLINHPLFVGFGSFLLGIGMGFSTTTFIVSIQTRVQWNVRGEATAMNMFMRLLGGAVGVALLGGVLNSRLQSYFEREGTSLGIESNIDAVNVLLDPIERMATPKEVLDLLQAGLTNGFTAVFVAVFIFAMISAVFISLLPKDDTAANKEST